MKGKKSKKDIISISMTNIEATKLYFAINDAIEQLRKGNAAETNISMLLSLSEVAEVIDGLKWTNNYTSLLD